MVKEFSIRKKILKSLQLAINFCGPACLQMIICRNDQRTITQKQLAEELSIVSLGSLPGIMAIVLKRYTMQNYKAKIIHKFYGKHGNDKEIINFADNVYHSLINDMLIIIGINGHLPGQYKNIAHYVTIFEINGVSNDPQNIIFRYCDPDSAKIDWFKGSDLITIFSNGDGVYIGQQWKNNWKDNDGA